MASLSAYSSKSWKIYSFQDRLSGISTSGFLLRITFFSSSLFLFSVAVVSLVITLALSSLRSILPLKLLGILSMNSTPPFNVLCGATRSSMNFIICSSVILSLVFFTTKAFGSSPALSSGTPITAASSMAELEMRRDSSSAGGTWELGIEWTRKLSHLCWGDREEGREGVWVVGWAGGVGGEGGGEWMATGSGQTHLSLNGNKVSWRKFIRTSPLLTALVQKEENKPDLTLGLLRASCKKKNQANKQIKM